MPKERAGWEQVCHSCKETTPREVLEKLYNDGYEDVLGCRLAVDVALADLSEIVMGLKKRKGRKGTINAWIGLNSEERKIYNQAITDIASLFTDKEKTCPCADCGKMRTADEGGTTFTVCDECWDKHYKEQTKKEEI